MKNYLLPLLTVFLLFSCNPDPQPELRENIIGKWNVRSDRSILELGSSWGPEIPLRNFLLEVFSDGTLMFQEDSLLIRQWEQVDRDHILVRLPENFLLQNMREIEIEFLKMNNHLESQYWDGYTVFTSDTARANPLRARISWDLTRLR